MIDEAWAVDPAAVDEGLEPATMERKSPQLHLTSTAHRQATSLMRRRITGALTGADEDSLLLVWAAPPDSDPGDPETWKAASPHWTPDREKMIRVKFQAAMNGEADPEADDLDPMAGFEAQYLNRWSLNPTTTQNGTPIVEPEAWDGLQVETPTGPPDAVAVEGWPAASVSVAQAWRVDSRAVVSVQDVQDVAAAAALVQASGFTRRPIVGASMADDPAWLGRAESATAAIRTAIVDFSGLLRDDAIRHDGGETLSGQVLGVRTSPGADGIRVRSTGRADAIKAVVWAANAARTARPPLSMEIILPD